MKLDRKQYFNFLYQDVVFSGGLEKQDGRPSLRFAYTYISAFSSDTAEQNSTTLGKK